MLAAAAADDQGVHVVRSSLAAASFCRGLPIVLWFLRRGEAAYQPERGPIVGGQRIQLATKPKDCADAP